MAGKDTGWHIVDAVRPHVWGVILPLPIFCWWSCRHPDHAHVDESDVGFRQIYRLQREVMRKFAHLRFLLCVIGAE